MFHVSQLAKANPNLLSSLNIKQLIISLNLHAMYMIPDPGPGVCNDKQHLKTVVRFNEHKPTNKLTMKWALTRVNLSLGVAKNKGADQPDLRSLLFVCFVALRPKSTAMVMVGRSVHITTSS